MNTKKQISKQERAGKTITNDSAQTLHSFYSIGRSGEGTPEEKTHEKKEQQTVFKEYYY